ncbi:hypothetical protein ACU4GD_43845 [Cupriavidus basilensis]
MSTNQPTIPTARAPRIPRRHFLGSAAVLTAALPLARGYSRRRHRAPRPRRPQARAGRTRFWPDDAQLVISVSMQFEAGAQPEAAAPAAPSLRSTPSTRTTRCSPGTPTACAKAFRA